MKARKTCPSLLLFAALVLTPVVPAATGNLWYDAFKTYDDAKGGAYVSSTDASILAWQESFMQRSYLNLYEATHEATWLTKFTTHANTRTRGKIIPRISSCPSRPTMRSKSGSRT